MFDARRIMAAGGGKKGKGTRLSGRNLKVKVKTARGRRTSSTRWLQRQLNDPYVQAAKRDGYRSRAAYKLIELDERFRLLKPGLTILDLGAAPGGWSQVAEQQLKGRGQIVAIDINEMDALPGVTVIQGDIMDPDLGPVLLEAFGGRVDLVLSDMAPPSTGHKSTDHLRIVALVEAAVALVREVLAPGGGFVAKVWEGGADADLLAELKRDFAQVKHAKPKASRSGSAEMYLVASGFRGGGEEGAE